MQTINIRNLLHLYGRKIICFVGVIWFILLSQTAGAQTKNLPFYGLKKLHFGFTIGTNWSDFRYRLSDDFYENDTLLTIDVQRYPGFTLGIVSNLHLGEYFDLRFIPTLILTQRTLNYSFSGGYTLNKDVESVFLEAPIHIKYKSIRHNNAQLYVIAGAKYGYDMSSEANAQQNPLDPFVAVIPHNYYYEFGFGFDLYFPYFKFSPELKISRGVNNVLDADPTLFSSSFGKVYSDFIFLSFLFE